MKILQKAAMQTKVDEMLIKTELSEVNYGSRHTQRKTIGCLLVKPDGSKCCSLTVVSGAHSTACS